MSPTRPSWRMVAATLLAALFLTLLPLPGPLAWLEPYWIALVMVYWALESHGVTRLGLAFVVGLLLDLVSGSLLGLHALSLVVIVFLVHRFRARLRFFPPWQQALAVLVLLVNDRVILLWINSLVGEPLPTWRYWVPPLVGMVLWPWIFLGIDRLRSLRRSFA